MQPETKSCQNCHKEFTIETEDFNFYTKINVPSPTWCPKCRMIRRMSCVNGWSLFWRNCDKCGKRTLSSYTPTQKLTVYCQPCWWADGWDGAEYAMEYDPSKPFLAQLKELALKTPYVALETSYLTLKNSEYTNEIAYSKDCFMVTWADFCESVYYSSILNGLKFSVDCLRGWESELCYGSIGFNKNYRTFFSEESDACVDVWFSRNCYSCTNCIGCVNLRGASYCIFNEKYSKEEYEQKVKELKLDSWKSLQELEKKAREFWMTQPYREYSGHSLNMNVTGEHIYTSKNCKECYVVNGTENSKWVQFVTVPPVKDSMDYSGWGNNTELMYESVQTGENASNVKFSAYCYPDSLNLEYCLWNISGKNNFGCVNLKRKSYSILNKQYSKEEYEKLKQQIIEDMKRNPYMDEKNRTWAYGEFFQSGFSRFAYNNTNAYKFFSKTKEEAEKEGYAWNNDPSPTYNISITAENLPDTMFETNDSIINEVIECMKCQRGYRIVKGELDLLRKMNIPIPHECPKCRENERFARMTKPGLYHRKCAQCNIEIYTPYPPTDPRIVYCVKCYQGEFA